MTQDVSLTDLLQPQRAYPQSLARALLVELLTLWNLQAPEMDVPPREVHEIADYDVLEVDLRALRRWFDPTATGKRLRAALARLDAPPLPPRSDLADLIERVGDDKALVTPEGRAAMWVLAEALGEAPSDHDSSASVWFSLETSETVWKLLADVYRSWNRRRLIDVLGLLEDETESLRPSAMGLMLVLLLNRNTSEERRLPLPRDGRQSDAISRAIAAPAIAFANALSGSESADARGLDLYRGWAVGEVARRLGSGLHRQDGIWIDEAYVDRVVERVAQALARLSARDATSVQSALSALVDEYAHIRGVLASLGAAHERPSYTRSLLQQVQDGIAIAIAKNKHEARE